MDSSCSSTNNISCAKPPTTRKIPISILVISLPLLYASLLHLPPSSLFKDTTFWFLISNSIIVIVAADSGVFASSPSSTADDHLYDEYIKYSKTGSNSCLVTVEMKPQHNANENDDSSKEPESKAKVTDEKEPEIVVKEAEMNEEEPRTELEVVVVKEAEMTEEEEPRTEVEVVIIAKEAEMTEEPPKQPTCKRSSSELSKQTVETKSLIPRSKTMMEKRTSCGMEESEYWKLSDEELNRKVEDFITRFNREIRLQEKMSTVY